MFQITICPSCGNNSLKKREGKWTGKFQKQTYTVPRLEFYECVDCGEKIYDPQAMRNIEAHSPAFIRKQKGKVSA